MISIHCCVIASGDDESNVGRDVYNIIPLPKQAYVFHSYHYGRYGLVIPGDRLQYSFSTLSPIHQCSFPSETIMSVQPIEVQPIDYMNPVQAFVQSMGITESLNKYRLNILFTQAAVDIQGNSLWQLVVQDDKDKVPLITGVLNSKGICTVTKQMDNGQQGTLFALQLSLATMYSYEYPFASLRAIDMVNPLAEFNRKAWGIWMNSSDGQEIASYLMSTGEQCRLCCVGTVTNTMYEMGFYCNGGKIARVKNDLIADRIYSFDPFTEGLNGQLNRVLAKIEFEEDADPYARVLCVITLLALSCYNVVTFFNPKSAPPKRRKRRR